MYFSSSDRAEREDQLGVEGCISRKGHASSGWSTDRSGLQNLYKLPPSVRQTLVLKTIFPLSVICFNMATVNMNYVEFYNPNLPSKPSHAQPTRLMLNKERPPQHPIESQPIALLRNGQKDWTSLIEGRGARGGDRGKIRQSIGDYN